MDRPLSHGARKPALPSQGGLLGRSFVYRSSSKTDVRLTWAQARAGQGPASEPERSGNRPGRLRAKGEDA